MKSYIGGQLYSLSPPHSLDPIVHKIGHDKQMDHLGDHEPIPDIFRQQAGGLFSIVLV